MVAARQVDLIPPFFGPGGTVREEVPPREDDVQNPQRERRRADGREGEETEPSLPHALEYAREEDVGSRPD